MFRPLLISMFITSTALADTWTVDNDGKADFDNIQAAINAASDGDEIIVMPGTYTGNTPCVIDPLGKRLWIHSNDGPEVTTIDGEGVRRVIKCTNGETNKTVFEGLTITGGNAKMYGGGFFNYSSNPTVTNCIFSNNTTEGDGAGMCNLDNSNPIIADCIFENNTANDEGGGMYNSSSSSPTLTDCAFVSNESVWGGGMRNYSSSSPSLTNCIFTNNISTEGGGGMHNSISSHPSLSECLFTKNTAQGGKFEDGGGMRNVNSSPTLINCSFEDNIAGDGGGGMYNNGSNPSLTNCTFDRNIAGLNGGGIRNYKSSPILENCTLTFNSASIGGGMRNYESSPTLTDTIVCGNTPDQIDGSWINNGGNTIANECPIYCPDINGDGFVNVVELLTVIDQWGATDSPADLNFDGTVDVSDLLMVVGNWGPCE